MLYKTDETGPDFLIKTLQFFLSFLCFGDVKTLFNDTLEGSLPLTLLVANGMHGREGMFHCFAGPTFHDWCLFHKQDDLRS